METLESLRTEIDKIDDEILDLLNKRAELAIKVAKIKKKNNSDFYSLEREQKIYERLTTKNRGPFPLEAIKPVFREIMSASLSLEQVLTVTYLGPEGTFTHLASLQHFGQSVNFVQVKGIPEIFNEVARGRANFGVVPIENSTEGVIYSTLDMFIDSPLKICAEILTEVSHHLMNLSGKIEDIKIIYSHPQAFAQCSRWLKENLPHIQTVERSSTAEAAKMVQGNPNCAAIASEFAARLYQLKIIRRKIEDNLNNFTRFWVIGNKISLSTKSDKTSIMFSVKDEAGALYKILKPFAENGINLTKIESRPFKKRAWEYIFFLDMEGYYQDPNIKETLEKLEKNSIFLKILGSYPSSKRP